ncbi:MAG: methyltransferase domain-containing protein [bacterium]
MKYGLWNPAVVMITRGGQHLGMTLHKLRKDYPDLPLFVCSNAPEPLPPGIAEMITDLSTYEGEVWLARQANIAAERALHSGCDPLIYMNDDIVGAKGWLEALLDGFEAHPHFAIVTAILSHWALMPSEHPIVTEIFPEGYLERLQQADARWPHMEVEKWPDDILDVIYQPWGGLDEFPKQIKLLKPWEGFILGSLMAIRREALIEQFEDCSPLFDERYKPFYCEETDLVAQMIVKGMEFAVVPGAFGHHWVGPSIHESIKDKPGSWEEGALKSREAFHEKWQGAMFKKWHSGWRWCSEWDRNAFAQIFPNYWMTGEAQVRRRAEKSKLMVEKLLRPGGKLLDAGCGGGTWYKFLTEAGLNPSQYLGLDSSRKMLWFARDHNPTGRFKYGWLQEPGFPENHFDAAMLIDIIQHPPTAEAGKPDAWPAIAHDYAVSVISALRRVTRGPILIRTWVDGESSQNEPQGYCTEFNNIRWARKDVLAIIAQAIGPVEVEALDDGFFIIPPK